VRGECLHGFLGGLELPTDMRSDLLALGEADRNLLEVIEECVQAFEAGQDERLLCMLHRHRQSVTPL
jgi:hypothetical protein